MKTNWEIEAITHLGEPNANAGSNAPLQLSKIILRPEYCKEWNETMRDFVVLTRNGELVNDSLYRVGGLGTYDITNKRYFMLLKYVEAFYDKKILEMSKSNDPKHLAGHWCIIDRNGIEKVLLPSFSSCYLIENSCIYYMNSKYYNIETGEFYCQSSAFMYSDEFIFLENRFDEDKGKRGVMKINKNDGSWSLFPCSKF